MLAAGMLAASSQWQQPGMRRQGQRSRGGFGRQLQRSGCCQRSSSRAEAPVMLQQEHHQPVRFDTAPACAHPHPPPAAAPPRPCSCCCCLCVCAPSTATPPVVPQAHARRPAAAAGQNHRAGDQDGPGEPAQGETKGGRGRRGNASSFCCQGGGRGEVPVPSPARGGKGVMPVPSLDREEQGCKGERSECS